MELRNSELQTNYHYPRDLVRVEGAQRCERSLQRGVASRESYCQPYSMAAASRSWVEIRLTEGVASASCKKQNPRAGGPWEKGGYTLERHRECQSRLVDIHCGSGDIG